MGCRRLSASVFSFLLTTGCIVALTAGAAAPGMAQTTIQEVERAPVLIQADRLTYDQELGVITAAGNVEAAQGGRIVKADSISYNERTDTLIASGNVALIEPTGEVAFADYVELTDEFKNGVVRGIRILLTDQSRFAAVGGRRVDGNRTIMKKVVYSPCELCKEDPERAPLWQLKASEVTHDREEKIIEYRNAFLEVYGVPVFYTPYFNHPDPTVKRKTGFLTPLLGSSSDLGLQASIPFFWNIAPHRDVTITPRLTSREGVVLSLEYRERFTNGTFTIDGSGTYVDERNDANEKTGEKVVRGHIRSAGDFRLDDEWTWGYELFRASDDTYLKRYDISDNDVLVTSPYGQGILGRDFAQATAYYFQDLRPDIDKETVPAILPFLEYQHIGEPSLLGGRFQYDVNAMQLFREDGTDSQRLSVGGGWYRPQVGPIGDIYTLWAGVRGDAYLVDDLDPDEDGDSFDGLSGRIWPVAALDWRYPLIRRGQRYNQTIEPIAQLVVTPRGMNSDNIPNEDSISFEFDDTNLFSINRFPGIDRVEDGSRVNYGLRAGIYDNEGGYANLIVGQSYSFFENDTFLEGSGLEDKLSDIVGRVSLVPSNLLNLVFRFRLDPDKFSLRRTESYASAGPELLRVRISYVRLGQELAFDEFGAREEINLAASSKLSENWTAFGEYRRDLRAQETLFTSFGLGYLDECIEILGTFERKFTRDRDIRPTTSFLLRFRLRHLG